MPATKRHKMHKKFRFNCNRKRLGRVRKAATSVAPTMPLIRKEWEEEKSVCQNISNMGLAFDVNATFKIPSTRDSLAKDFKCGNQDISKEKSASEVLKAHVVNELEKEANAPREKKFELPKGQFLRLSHLLDKYGDDYKAMARDSGNLNQETWRQIRSKIRSFQNVPSQWTQYLVSKAAL